MVRYNSEQLIRVAVSDFVESNCKYIKENKFLGITIRGKGFYIQGSDPLNGGFLEYHGQNCPDNTVFKDGIVFLNPTVRAYFQSGSRVVKHFETLPKAQAFAKKITESKKWFSM